MLSLLALALFSLSVAYTIHLGSTLVKNIRIAKSSGMRYIVLPFFVYGRLYRVFHPLILTAINKVIPHSLTASWLHVADPDWPWIQRYQPFADIGTDTFLTVAPSGIMMWTADADVISQVTMRRNDFPKPIALYELLDIYGSNVVTSEGTAWRHQRRLTTPPFTESNNHLVWKETLDQTQQMVSAWAVSHGRDRGTVLSVAEDTMRLSLHVISRAGFGQSLQWPKSGDAANAFAEDETSQGHSMSFAYSIHYVLEQILLIILLPKWLLRNAPFKVLQKAHQAYEEWGKYMREMIAQKKAAVESGAPEASSIDIISQLVKGQSEGAKEKSKSGSPATLTDIELMGNCFVFILAGHETTANSIHFSMLFLALKPKAQRKFQKELDEIFQNRPISEWDYDRDLPKLFGGMAGAIMNEELRLMQPGPVIPKSVTSDRSQTLIVDGKEVTAPPGIHVAICASSVHRNPKYWPHGPPRDLSTPYFPPSNLDNDLEEFKPERWLKPTVTIGDSKDNPSSLATSTPMPDTPSLNNTSDDTSSTLYTPPRGSYIPFSTAHRACLGRRFAQVEILAALAVIFSQYSVELVPSSPFPSPEDLDLDSLQNEWSKAEAEANHIWMTKSKILITLQIKGARVPLRVVRRGEERYAALWEED